MWLNRIIEKLGKNHYKLIDTESGYFIEFEIYTDIGDYEIEYKSSDMSKDHIIFISKLFETEPNDDPCIGEAWLYDADGHCTKKGLVSARIIDSTHNNPKGVIENNA